MTATPIIPGAGCSHRLIDEFIRQRCASDMLKLRVFPNAKEITESMAAYAAVRELANRGVLPFNLSTHGVALLAVGDGHTPRTGALFAFRSAWDCYSVDPALARRAHEFAAVRRLICLPGKVENMEPIACEHAVVAAVHSHAQLADAVRIMRPASGKVTVVAMPCCVPQWLPEQPNAEYQDLGIWSAERTVRVWHGVEARACNRSSTTETRSG